MKGTRSGTIRVAIGSQVVEVPSKAAPSLHGALVGARQHAVAHKFVFERDEETVVLGYMVTRLQQVGTPALAAIGVSAVLRGSYHLYQGWGGFTGNLLMGLLFGLVFLRWRRTWPMVIAHTLLDVGAGVLFILFQKQIPGLLAG